MTNGPDPQSNSADAVFSVVQALCSERSVAATRQDCKTVGWLAVKLKGASHEWKLYVYCENATLSLPSVRLVPPLGLLPHVGYDGTVCVNDGQGLSIDPDRGADIAAHTLLAGYDLLEKWSADDQAARAEFLNELEGYWSGLPDALRGRAAIEVDDNDRLISAYEDHRHKPATWYFAERGSSPREFDVSKLKALRALYVHLDALPAIPVHPQHLSHEFVENVRATLTPAQAEIWNALVGPSKNGPRACALLVSIPRQAGGKSLVGVAFSAYKGAVDRRVPVVPLTVKRQTAAYMRERGGASLELLGKHISVLGCGAIGSVVADTLAAAGIGKLTLVDNDEYTEDNVFRHVLDPAYIGFPKSWGLRHQLERRYPGLRVTAIEHTAQRWLAATNLQDLDGVVLAFGAPSVERSFARAFREQEHRLPVVFTWLEALDLGGHSVLMWSDKPGCLDCLYRDDEGGLSLHPRTSFLEANQHVTRNLTGCANVFVPYGALQARKTGLMAAEHILNALSGIALEASYRFWAGEGVEAQAHELKTTPWWSVASNTSTAEATARVFGRPCRRCRDDT